MKRLAFIPALLCLATLPSQAALVWTGAGDGISLYAEANWLDDNGVVPAANTINGNTVITAATGGSILITSGAGSPSNFGGNFQIGATDLTVGGGKVLASAGSQVIGGGSSSLSADGGAIRTGQLSGFNSILVDNSGEIDLFNTSGIQGAASMPITVQNGSTISTQFITNSMIQVDGTSSIEFLGGGNPINNTTVDLATSGTLILVSAAEIDEHIGGNKIFVNGVQVTLANRDSLLAISGGTAVAIPEPSSLLLSSFAGLLLLRRRRR